MQRYNFINVAADAKREVLLLCKINIIILFMTYINGNMFSCSRLAAILLVFLKYLVKCNDYDNKLRNAHIQWLMTCALPLTTEC